MGLVFLNIVDRNVAWRQRVKHSRTILRLQPFSASRPRFSDAAIIIAELFTKISLIFDDSEMNSGFTSVWQRNLAIADHVLPQNGYQHGNAANPNASMVLNASCEKAARCTGNTFLIAWQNIALQMRLKATILNQQSGNCLGIDIFAEIYKAGGLAFFHGSAATAPH